MKASSAGGESIKDFFNPVTLAPSDTQDVHCGIENTITVTEVCLVVTTEGCRM